MSASNRTPGQRVVNDVYGTSAWCVDRLLDAFALPSIAAGSQDWLEPCAGSGAIIKAVNAWVARQDGAPPPDLTKRHVPQPGGPIWHANELRPECNEALRACALCVRIGTFQELNGRYRVAITNPPYALAQEVIAHCLTLAKEAWMLLRVNFLGSEKREAFFEEYGMPDVYVLPNRPSFGLDKEGKVGTDATEYAWMKWTAPDQPQQEGKVYRLALTPAAELAAAKALIRQQVALRRQAVVL